MLALAVVIDGDDDMQHTREAEEPQEKESQSIHARRGLLSVGARLFLPGGNRESQHDHADDNIDDQEPIHN